MVPEAKSGAMAFPAVHMPARASEARPVGRMYGGLVNTPIQAYKTVQKNPPDMLVYDEEFEHYDFPNGSLVADQGLAVLQPDGVLWATGYMIDQANNKFKELGTDVRLRKGTQKKVGGFLGFTYFKVIPRKFENDQIVNEAFTLIGDCGQAARRLLGSPFSLTFGKHSSGSLIAAGDEFNKQQFNDLVEFLRSNSSYLDALVPRMSVSDITNANHRDVFSRLSEEARAKFNKSYGYDNFANPGLGQAYVMFPDQRRPGFVQTACPYHFGYVMMETGADRITLEQYTGKNESEWYFGIYQAGDPKKDFQERWNSSFNSFGTTAVAKRK